MRVGDLGDLRRVEIGAPVGDKPALAVPAEQRPMVFLTFLMVLLIMKGRVHALSGNDYLYPFLLTYFVACILPDIHFAGYV